MPNTTRSFNAIRTAASEIVELDSQYNAEIGIASIREKRIEAGESIEVQTYINTGTGSVISIKTKPQQALTPPVVTTTAYEVDAQPREAQTQTTTQMIINLNAEGLTVSEIAKALAIRYQHVANTLIRKELPMKYTRKQPDSNLRIAAQTIADTEDQFLEA